MIELILIILVILVVAAVSIFAWVDYNKHKKSNETDFTKVDKNIKTEGETRLSNLKFVVDQVNKTNEEMDTTYVKKFGELDASMSNYTNFKTGFGSLITVRGSNINNIDITNPALRSTITDVDMIKRVSFLGGATIKDLQKGGNSLEICGSGNSPSCIRLPDDKGDTYLTSLEKDRNIVFGAPIKANEIVDFYKSVNLYNGATATTPTLSLQANDEGASLSTKDILSIKTGTNEVMGIGLGGVMVNGNVTLRSASGATTATLSIGDDGVLNVAGANKMRVNGKEMASVAINEIDVGGNADVGANANDGDNINVNETFCTLPANQGKNYQCTDDPYKSMNVYFQLLDGEVLSYNKWNQAVENAAVSKVTLTAEGYNNCAKVREQCKMNNMKRPKYDE